MTNNSGILTFNRKRLENVYLKPLRQTFDCLHYCIKRDSDLIFDLFSTPDITLISLPTGLLRIERRRKLFRKTQYYIYDHPTNCSIGTLEFLDRRSANKTCCIVTFANNSTYKLEQNNSISNIFRPKTWNQYLFEMHDYNDAFVTYSGTKTNGTITSNNLERPSMIAVGMYIIDEKFRIISESD